MSAVVYNYRRLAKELERVPPLHNLATRVRRSRFDTKFPKFIRVADFKKSESKRTSVSILWLA